MAWAFLDDREQAGQEWVAYPHWYCEHGHLVGFGCDDCADDEDADYGATP